MSYCTKHLMSLNTAGQCWKCDRENQNEYWDNEYIYSLKVTSDFINLEKAVSLPVVACGPHESKGQRHRRLPGLKDSKDFGSALPLSYANEHKREFDCSQV